MSLGTQALLLLRLHARAGQWVGVDELARHFGWPGQQVCDELRALHARGYVELAHGELPAGEPGGARDSTVWDVLAAMAAPAGERACV